MGIFEIYVITFLLEKLWNMSMGLWIGSTSIDSRVYESLIERGLFNPRCMQEIRTRRGMLSCPQKIKWMAEI
jgi:hypothetical protein